MEDKPQPEQEQQKNPRMSSMFLKATLHFEEPLTQFFYYLNGDKSYLVGKMATRVMVLNTISKLKQEVQVGTADFVLNSQFPPYVFVIMRERWIDCYRVSETMGGIELAVSLRISKMEPKTIARYNKGYFIGGYNRSPLPGNRKTTKRTVYFMTQLKHEGKNKPDEQIALKSSETPISLVEVQTPYMLVYCHPIAYLLSIKSREVMITFEKDISQLTLIEGRYAISNINGIGITSKNLLFSFDVERFPMFGVEITDHKEAPCDYFCMQRTGRIFCSCGPLVYEYLILKKQMKVIVKYKEGESVVGINCTSNNNLMVLKKREKMVTLDVFVLQ